MFWGVGQVEEGGREGCGGVNMPEQLCFGEWDRWRRVDMGEGGGGTLFAGKSILKFS